MVSESLALGTRVGCLNQRRESPENRLANATTSAADAASGGKIHLALTNGGTNCLLVD